MTPLLRDRDLVRAYDPAAPAYDLLTAPDPGHLGAPRRPAAAPAGAAAAHPRSAHPEAHE
ncbi:hypothetical protein ACFV1W_21590 [Kitasatospora sp. NPDC059648]|uniref:hypothetical protein n=1 Tax=Kitasatospora sp. NPDC059648 TaxID=3346894 RepID=UPI003698CC0D